ncbi:MAG: hypothetical protein NDJ92_20675 [Thermoanaerobaculia bacterium]|nr:hypothetical protein [Thermoanaerobaculia bacterium]
MNQTRFAVVVVNCLLAACGWAEAPGETAVRAPEPILGLPCENCEEVFNGLPSSLASSARIAPAGEPGEPLRVEGTVTDSKGRPAAGIVVYAYHTDAGGVYPRDAGAEGRRASRHGRLRGWAKTDGAGRYRFDTIRPASYPNGRLPQHIHMHVIEPGRGTYWIDDVVFDDDPYLTAAERGRAPGRGGSGVTEPRRDAGGTWLVVRDIRLGAQIPGYPAVE